MLPNTVFENRQWDRWQTKFRIGHTKLTHDTILQGNNPQHVKTGEDTPLSIKLLLKERLSLNNRRLQLFGSTNKTMIQLLNDGDTTYGDTLYKFCYLH